MCYQVPKCLKRRHQILDSIEQQITQFLQKSDAQSSSPDEEVIPKKLVCNLWNLLQEKPPCEGCSARLMPTSSCAKCYGTTANSTRNTQVREPNSKSPPELKPIEKEMPAEVKSPVQMNAPVEIKSPVALRPTIEGNKIAGEVIPLPASGKYFDGRIYQVYNATEIKKFDDSCTMKINDLLMENNGLIEQIQDIEKREQEGMKLLQEADEMWERMEEAYKIKIEETWHRQKILSQQLQEIEESTRNWKKAKKDSVFEHTVVDKVKQELNENKQRKLKKISMHDEEIAGTECKIKAIEREIEATEKSLGSKTKHSDAVRDKIANKIKELSGKLTAEKNLKAQKEAEGTKYISDGQGDLQRMWKLLLEKRLQTEDLHFQQETIQNDIAILKAAFEDCKDRCRIKMDDLMKRIDEINNAITSMTTRCSRCHEAVDTSDAKNVCMDCPRCLKRRECARVGDTCKNDTDKECVCVVVKQMFMENVLENMNAVLQRQVKAGMGKAVGEVVLKCLERSSDGKVDVATRKILKDFILTTVRKHLDTTIVGGAVKTRCELDAETYKKLMLCIKDTKLDRIPTGEKSTNKKDPCKYWGDTECNCGSGPLGCLCAKKAPQSTKSEPTRFCSEPARQPGARSLSAPVSKDDDAKTCKTVKEPPTETPLEELNFEKWQDTCKIGSCPGVLPVPDVTRVESQIKKNFCSEKENHACSTECCGKDSDKESIRQSKSKEPTDSEYVESDTSRDKRRSINIREDHPHKNAKGNITSDFKITTPEASSVVRLSKKCVNHEGKPKKVKRHKKGKSKPIDDNVIELTRTPSGTPAMAFDEKIIEKINKKLDESSDMQVNLRKLNSSRFVLEINKDQKNDSEIAKVRRTPSGNLVLDAPKSIINLSNKPEKPILSNIAGETVLLCIKTEDGNSMFVDGTFTKSESGVVRIDLQNSLKIKEFLNEKVPGSVANKPQSFLATVAEKMERELSFCGGAPPGESKSKRKESSLEKQARKLQNEMSCPEDLPMLLKIIEENDSSCNLSQPKVKILDKMCRSLEDELNISERRLPRYNHSLHKIRIFGLYPTELFEPPAVLRRTQSGHYVFIMDKEYDKQYRLALSRNVLNENVRVSKTESGKIINIDLNSNNKDPCDTECHLVKTDSGNLKLMITDEKLRSNAKKVSEATEKVSGDKIDEAFENALMKIFPHNVDPDKKRIQVHESIDNDSIKTEDGSMSYLNSDPKTIKRTESGTYSLILDSNSKQHFIDNIQQLLKKKRHGLPINITNSGDIKIELKPSVQTKGTEYLRITPSGSVYLLVNDDTVQGLNVTELSKKTLNKEGVTNEEKAICTFCNADPTDASCDLDRCNCKELMRQLNDSCCVIDYKTSFVKAKGNYQRHDCHQYQQWFCITDSDDRFVCDSNEILEISSTCDNDGDASHLKPIVQQKTSNKAVNEFFWDHIEDLPQQLPQFLRS